TAIAGRPVNLDGVTAHGNTDTGILRDAFALAGIAEPEWRPRLAEICARMCGFVEAHRHEFRIRALPMVRDVVSALRGSGRMTGIATGNLESIGRCKLAAAGLDDLFDFAAWSDGLEHRADVFARAVQMARARRGEHARIVAVGDTPADIQAAHANGLAAVAVATGIYSYEQLQAESPELCIHSFEALTIPA
ncbi:MAG: HAD family hydrolase, partial [Acidobacteriota bacterium]